MGSNPLANLGCDREVAQYVFPEHTWLILAKKRRNPLFYAGNASSAFKRRDIDGAVRLLMRFIKVKWKVRAQYSEPALRAKQTGIGEQSG